MTKHIEAMKMALDAMELHAKMYPHMQKGYTVDAISALKEALAEAAPTPQDLELENRCVRELRDYAKANQGTYIFPGWDGRRITKYLSSAPTPPPECKTEAEKTAFAFGWFKAQEAMRAASPAQPAKQWVPDMAHCANEWADVATNGLQWLRNIRDGYSTVETAITNMEAGLKHCQDTYAQMKAAQPVSEPVEPVAWAMQRTDGLIMDVISPDEHAREEGGYTIPLYTSPQRELSDEQIRVATSTLIRFLLSCGNGVQLPATSLCEMAIVAAFKSVLAAGRE